ncbi:hypothetical protein AOQ84DRAFT_426230 [Glonium stellatum]|uniref:Protein kinase domain-containing protein n=1 Tax=Glonium stellatum TaxID=574774 RepID=A0A8E2JVH8_9PEZI|nr:hypothetical protein AOQ84DRAFT_426230 [Glonium stellatum]
MTCSKDVEKICSRLYAKCAGDKSSSFIAWAYIKEILNEDVVSQLVAQCNTHHGLFTREQIRTDIFNRGRRILAILVLIERVHRVIRFFESDSLDDNRLPMSEHDLDKIFESNRYQCSRFYETQFIVNAPKFEEGVYRRLHDWTRMPFLKEVPLENQGYNSHVSIVTVPMDYINYVIPQSSTHSSTQSSRDPLLASANCCDGDFEKFGPIKRIEVVRKELKPFDKETKELVIHPPLEWTKDACLAALIGLSDAITYIHHFTSKDDDFPKIGCHNDLKPKNVLVDTSNEKFILIDFGLAEVHAPIESQDLQTRMSRDDYAPPAQKIQPTQNDMWAFGCIMNEMIVYLHDLDRNSNTVDDYRRTRKVEMPGPWKQTFYTFHGISKPNDGVEDRFKQIKQSGSPLIKNLAELNRQILEIQSNKRLCDAKDVTQKLQDIQKSSVMAGLHVGERPEQTSFTLLPGASSSQPLLHTVQNEHVVQELAASPSPSVLSTKKHPLPSNLLPKARPMIPKVDSGVSYKSFLLPTSITSERSQKRAKHIWIFSEGGQGIRQWAFATTLGTLALYCSSSDSFEQLLSHVAARITDSALRSRSSGRLIVLSHFVPTSEPAQTKSIGLDVARSFVSQLFKAHNGGNAVSDYDVSVALARNDAKSVMAVFVSLFATLPLGVVVVCVIDRLLDLHELRSDSEIQAIKEVTKALTSIASREVSDGPRMKLFMTFPESKYPSPELRMYDIKVEDSLCFDYNLAYQDAHILTDQFWEIYSLHWCQGNKRELIHN